MPEGRFWWQQQADYWNMPFWHEADMIPYFCAIGDWVDSIAAREQLWAIREGLV